MRITTLEELQWALNRPTGFIVNENTAADGSHRVHTLPLQRGCQRDKMNVNPPYYKYYVANIEELQALDLGTEGPVWSYCQHCRR